MPQPIAGLALAAALALTALSAAPATAGTVLEEWGALTMPGAPQAQDARLAPGTTALLILDMQPQTCNQERRPRCPATRAPIAALAERARAAGAPVVYSIVRNSEPGQMFPEMGWREGDPWVRSSVDKFLGTDLEKILKDRGVDTVIVTGTAAQGAVLHTATGAAQRGLKVVVPVDGLSSEDLFTEAAAVWALVSGPATRDRTMLTVTERITFVK